MSYEELFFLIQLLTVFLTPLSVAIGGMAGIALGIFWFNDK